MLTYTARLKCDNCGIEMKGRAMERGNDLRDRARRAGWVDSWRANYRDLCQVCAPKPVPNPVVVAS